MEQCFYKWVPVLFVLCMSTWTPTGSIIHILLLFSRCTANRQFLAGTVVNVIIVCLQKKYSLWK